MATINLLDFEDFDYDWQHPVPYYDNGEINYYYTPAFNLDIDLDADGEFVLDFLRNLDGYYKIQIGDTYYVKGVDDFLLDYGYQSNDFSENLAPLIEQEIWIFR